MFVVVATKGAVNSPVEEIVPAVADHVTALEKFPLPSTDAVHELVPPDTIVEGKQFTVTLVMVGDAGFTVTVVEPILVGSCTDVARIVIAVAEVTIGAVNSPDNEIVPAVADHVIAVE